MNTTEQLAVITKKAWFTKNIGLATRTSRLAQRLADYGRR